MNWFLSICLFLLGLLVGSFLNCVIYRLRAKESFLKGFSRCPHCRHKLGWQDLIPVLSFITLKGRCRYCRQKISLQYPLVEIATGALFLSIFNFQFSIFNEFSILNFQILFSIFYFLVSSCLLVIIFVYDLKHYIIPNKIIYSAIGIALIFNFQFSWMPSGGLPGELLFNFQSAILSAFGAAAFFFLIWLLSRGRWLGFGDVKLGFFMGLFLGFPNILTALFLAFLIGAIIGVGLIISGKKKLSSEVPFGPFLVTGTFLALFWGKSLINWYLNLFL